MCIYILVDFSLVLLRIAQVRCAIKRVVRGLLKLSELFKLKKSALPIIRLHDTRIVSVPS